MTGTATVLVVEDERELADLFADWLATTYDVRTAYTAAEALDEFDEAVDVVLLDRRLPERSGDDVLEEIHASGHDCQVAMVTAVDPDFDMLELGIDAYVVKPVDRDDLEGLVSRLLARSLYSEEVQEYFALASKRATLETTKQPKELAANERYQELQDAIEEKREDLDSLMSELDDEDFLAVIRGLDDRESATTS
ncbi:response regulator transcription factor [Halobacterium jilantaiense]|uniref:Response regulator receiver domain-containing protein n=1 Tax=Halobacterium jilantaiense TaxID=355548 RepID=A0A1I0MI27_9EURY|nr:HalX domain-containing protein [Halobacterium jilantaiense]SEV87698.1 Response regulator receiver domain-containing protein [Halobacterium jilantaiense]